MADGAERSATEQSRGGAPSLASLSAYPSRPGLSAASSMINVANVSVSTMSDDASFIFRQSPLRDGGYGTERSALLRILHVPPSSSPPPGPMDGEGRGDTITTTVMAVPPGYNHPHHPLSSSPASRSAEITTTAAVTLASAATMSGRSFLALADCGSHSNRPSREGVYASGDSNDEEEAAFRDALATLEVRAAALEAEVAHVLGPAIAAEVAHKRALRSDIEGLTAALETTTAAAAASAVANSNGMKGDTDTTGGGGQWVAGPHQPHHQQQQLELDDLRARYAAAVQLQEHRRALMESSTRRRSLMAGRRTAVEAEIAALEPLIGRLRSSALAFISADSYGNGGDGDGAYGGVDGDDGGSGLTARHYPTIGSSGGGEEEEAVSLTRRLWASVARAEAAAVATAAQLQARRGAILTRKSDLRHRAEALEALRAELAAVVQSQNHHPQRQHKYRAGAHGVGSVAAGLDEAADDGYGSGGGSGGAAAAASLERIRVYYEAQRSELRRLLATEGHLRGLPTLRGVLLMVEQLEPRVRAEARRTGEAAVAVRRAVAAELRPAAAAEQASLDRLTDQHRTTMAYVRQATASQ